MVDFIVFIILFVGGIVLLGISWELPTAQGVVCSAGILAISLALGYVMRQAGSATRRSNNWGTKGE